MDSRAKAASILAVIGFVVFSVVPAVPAAGQTLPRRGLRARAPLARLQTGPYRPIVLELRGLRLTPEQRQQVMAIFKAHRADLQALGEKARAARQSWQQSGKIDIQERKALNEQRQAIVKAARVEVLALLTPDQRKQIEARRQRALTRRDS
jgi:Spy/CpxP family protein refolding chaperone